MTVVENHLSIMPDSDQRRRLSFVGTVVKNSTIVTVIGTAVFLCVVCGRPAVRTSASVDTIYYSADKNLEIRDHGEKCPFRTPVTDINSTWVATRATSMRLMKQYSAIERSLWPNSRQTDHHSNAKTNKQVTISDESSRGAFYSTHNVGDYAGFKQADRVVTGTGFAAVRGPRLQQRYSPFYGYLQYRPTASSPTMAITTGPRLRTKYRPSRRPAKIHPRPSPPRTVMKSVLIPVSKTNGIDWNTVGILALVKLGLIKLKAFGVLKNAFVVLFKFKLFLAALFYKAVLILKLTKFLKTKILSLVVLSLLPILTSVFLPTILGALSSIPGRLQQLLPSPTNASAAQPSVPSQPNVLPTNRPARRLGRKLYSTHRVTTAGRLLDQPFNLPDIRGY